jgi:hypothetical protein
MEKLLALRAKVAVELSLACKKILHMLEIPPQSRRTFFS